VDSTVSAVLLKEMGYEVEGVYMIMHNLEHIHHFNIKKAKKVADYLGIKLHIEDIQQNFQDEVYNYFVNSYKKGLTPNPCVVCNREIKFGEMVRFADSLGIEYIATGHYARVKDGFFYKGRDKNKDQSYFLARVKKDIVDKVIFPLGDWLKEDVKEYAKNIEVLREFATQSESSEICFVENSYIDILKEHFNPNRPGPIKNSRGKIIGKHKGYMHYTIGKRRGLFIRGAQEPHYVVDINAKTNTLIVGKKEDLAKDLVRIKNINLFEPKSSFEAEVKVRYRTKGVKGRVTIIDDKGVIELKEPVYGVARGQFAVFYDGEKLLGGGEIVG